MATAKKQIKISPSTELSSLNLPNFQTILEQIFLYPEKSSGLTPLPAPVIVQDLVEPSLMPLEKVIQRLQLLQRLTVDIELDWAEFKLLSSVEKKDQLLLIDLRKQRCQDEQPIPDALPYAYQDFDRLYGLMKEREKVIFICEDGCQSFSAAIFVRDHNIPHACYLKDGYPS